MPDACRTIPPIAAARPSQRAAARSERPAALPALHPASTVLQTSGGMPSRDPRPAGISKRIVQEEAQGPARGSGADYVGGSLARADDFNSVFQQLTTKMAWGMIWTRPGLRRMTGAAASS